jgi:FkbM family methyltransferase
MIDIGANIGASTIPLAVKHNSIKFYCYEPHPVVFNRLESNVKLNQLKNINTINCAISDSDKEHLVFYAQKKSGNMGKSSLKHNQDIGQCDEIKVPIKNIDITFSDSNENIVLIKIDTQGTEPEIIRACKKTISEHRPVIFFEFEDRYYTDDERSKEKIFLSNFFNELNYSLLNISEDINYYPSIDITKKYHGDILAIPR